MKYTNRLRVVRAEQRITQEQIETKTHKRITQTRLSCIENGYGTPPTEKEKRILSRVLKTPVQDIFPSSEAVTS